MPTLTVENVLSFTCTSGAGVDTVTLVTTASGSGTRIISGSTSTYTDVAGNTWLADTYFTGGNIADRGAIAIANTTDDKVYQTERWGLTGYSIPITNGSYTARLHFAETSPDITGPNQRLFSVSIGGTTVLTNFDIYVAAGNAKNSAVVREFPITVSNGTASIGFVANVQATMINGIEII